MSYLCKKPARHQAGTEGGIVDEASPKVMPIFLIQNCIQCSR